MCLASTSTPARSMTPTRLRLEAHVMGRAHRTPHHTRPGVVSTLQLRASTVQLCSQHFSLKPGAHCAHFAASHLPSNAPPRTSQSHNTAPPQPVVCPLSLSARPAPCIRRKPSRPLGLLARTVQVPRRAHDGDHKRPCPAVTESLFQPAGRLLCPPRRFRRAARRGAHFHPVLCGPAHMPGWHMRRSASPARCTTRPLACMLPALAACCWRAALALHTSSPLTPPPQRGRCQRPC